MSTTKAILRAKSPQSAGVSAKVVNEFFKNAKEKGLDYHSLMVIRNGKVAVEWYNEPFDKNTTHSMYSVSKSFTYSTLSTSSQYMRKSSSAVAPLSPLNTFASVTELTSPIQS